MDRRETLAKYITAKNNPWFAKSFVNRIWAELVGQPFTEVVDDMGPGHEAQAQKVLDVLATDFVNSGRLAVILVATVTQTARHNNRR